jgi:hypothetical protein
MQHAPHNGHCALRAFCAFGIHTRYLPPPPFPFLPMSLVCPYCSPPNAPGLWSPSAYQLMGRQDLALLAQQQLQQHLEGGGVGEAAVTTAASAVPYPGDPGKAFLTAATAVSQSRNATSAATASSVGGSGGGGGEEDAEGFAAVLRRGAGRWPLDTRLQEAVRLLRSSAAVTLRVERKPEVVWECMCVCVCLSSSFSLFARSPFPSISLICTRTLLNRCHTMRPM